MRDRLIEILHKTIAVKDEDTDDYIEWLADELLANGIIVPLCTVGQTVWLIKSLNLQHTEWGVKEGKVSMIQQKADKTWKFRVTKNHSVADYTVNEIDKTVFLTREEAEKALKE